MKNSKLLVLLAAFLLVGSLASVQAQNVVYRTYKPQQSALFLKAAYITPDLNIMENINADLDYGTLGILRGASLGLALRIPIWNFIYIQPEALYSYQSNWEEYQGERGLLPVWNSFKNRTGDRVDVPIFAGVRWDPIDVLAVRGYVGAIGLFTSDEGKLGFQKGQYRAAAGVGVDVLRFLTADITYSCNLEDWQTIFDHPTIYLSVGLKL